MRPGEHAKAIWLAPLALPPLILALAFLLGVSRLQHAAIVTVLGTASRNTVQTVPAGVPVNVRWTEQVTPAMRSALESRYRLRRGIDLGDPNKRTWQYSLEDLSRANIEALVLDERHVEDTAGIDRTRMAVTGRE